jgi:hypothetical protein
MVVYVLRALHLYCNKSINVWGAGVVVLLWHVYLTLAAKLAPNISKDTQLATSVVVIATPPAPDALTLLSCTPVSRSVGVLLRLFLPPLGTHHVPQSE